MIVNLNMETYSTCTHCSPSMLLNLHVKWAYMRSDFIAVTFIFELYMYVLRTYYENDTGIFLLTATVRALSTLSTYTHR